MGPGFPSEQPSLAYGLTQNPNDTGHMYQSRSEFLSSNLESNGMSVSSSTPISYLHRPRQLEFDSCNGLEYLPIPQSVPNTPNNQSQFDSQPPFPPNDLSHTQAHDQGHLDIGTAAAWGGPSLQIEQGKIMDHLGPQGALFSSAPQGSSSQMTIGPAFGPSDESYSQSRVQDYLPYVTSFPPGQVQDAAQSHLATHGQNATTQASKRREQKAQEKKEKDRVNKRDHRSRNAEDFQRICALLDIPLKPKNRLAHRILEVVQGLVEQHEVDSDLRDQLKEKEAKVALLKMKCLKKLTEADTGSSPPINTHAAWPR
ncbi:hypothetical protein F5888DRAFT_1804779 [Russula emetica]|nr:hypothetical protein F5888DRAFT_1810531 [Russula emetica]KAF8495805.1 hypothetical protein F5888DRAFT_1804779 [Russula emetica]